MTKALLLRQVVSIPWDLLNQTKTLDPKQQTLNLLLLIMTYQSRALNNSLTTIYNLIILYFLCVTKFQGLNNIS